MIVLATELPTWVGPALSPLAAATMIWAARWLWHRFEAKMDENRAESRQEFAEVKGQLARLTDGQDEHAKLLQSHSERLAWLEGQSGQPLGSVDRKL